MRKKVFGVMVLLGFLSSCYKDKEELLYPGSVGVNDTTAATYNAYIKPLIATRCVNCHPNYGDYAGLNGVVSNGKFKDRVVTAKTMPQGSSLTAAQISKISLWLNAGGLNN
ncbi:MAG: hypothetical protein SGJ00_02790 [bacterium]|nr:hypothetical protein [bacterium]